MCACTSVGTSYFVFTCACVLYRSVQTRLLVCVHCTHMCLWASVSEPACCVPLSGRHAHVCLCTQADLHGHECINVLVCVCTQHRHVWAGPGVPAPCAHVCCEEAVLCEAGRMAALGGWLSLGPGPPPPGPESRVSPQTL